MTRSRTTLGYVLLSTIVIASCSSGAGPSRAPAQSTDRPGPAREQITAGGEAAMLGSLSEKPTDHRRLASRITALIRENSLRSARTTIAHNVDAARAIVLQTIPSDLDAPSDQFTAATLDALADIPSKQWLATLAWRSSNTPSASAFERERSRLLTLIHEGHFDQAARIDLIALITPDAPPPLRSEADRLNALPLLVTGQNQIAASILADAFARAESDDPITAPTLGLLATEAALRADLAPSALDLWLRTVHAATRNARLDILEPVLWQRIAEIRPQSAQWPESTRTLLINVSGLEDSDDTALNATIANWLFIQDAYPAALVAFKQAETTATSESSRLQLRIHQARCLIAMDQEPAAASVLAALATSDIPDIAGQARAILALQQIDIGRGQEAMSLLTSAASLVEGTEHAPAVAADLGLLCLTLGQNDRGIALLLEAAEEFKTSQRWDDWLQVQRNLAIFFEDSGDNARLQQVRQEIRLFEQSPQSSPDRGAM